MKKLFFFFSVFVFSAVIISDSVSKHTPPALTRVVTHIDIVSQQENVTIERHYNDQEKMESVLLYLRLLQPLYKPEIDPETIGGDVYEITLHYSDGQSRSYRQKAHRFISMDHRPWQTVDPEHAAGLYALMQHYPSDPPIL